MAYYRSAWRDDSKNIYMLGSNPNFSFAHFNRAKLGGGAAKCYLGKCQSLFFPEFSPELNEFPRISLISPSNYRKSHALKKCVPKFPPRNCNSTQMNSDANFTRLAALPCNSHCPSIQCFTWTYLDFQNQHMKPPDSGPGCLNHYSLRLSNNFDNFSKLFIWSKILRIYICI